ncbi:MAG: LamG domain-containing protein [Planctomycetaceae bacterium]|nr:LamG domain-containing protein [Planctomycetaceae bacterium]
MTRSTLILALAGVLCLAASAQAGTVTQALWLMGEDDPGATAGNAVNATGVDSSGNGNTLTLYDEWWPVGSKPEEVPANPILATYVAPGAGPASSLAVSMSTGDPMYYYTNTVSLAADHGIEMWVRLTNNGQRRDAFWSSGLGIWNPGGQTINFHLSGTGDLATFTYEDGAWYNLAIVTVGGQTTFYVNGESKYSFEHGGINGGDLTIAGVSGNNSPWDGAMDNIRVFNVDGAFDPMSDLTLSMDIPEPATMSLLALGGLAALIRRKRQ